jgi:transcriptional regulator with XRE-family HTH domain
MERKVEDPEVLRLVVLFLRESARMSQVQLSKAARMSQSQISLMELGRMTPSEDVLRRLAAAADVPWPLVAHIRQFYTAFVEARSKKGDFDERRATWAGAQESLAVQSYLLEEENQADSLAAEKAEAQWFWQAVAGLPRHRRRRAVELSPCASKNWALALLACDTSREVAASDPKEAIELADLALLIAEQAEKLEPEDRSRLLGYSWAHKANALRVSSELAEANGALSRAWQYWRAGASLAGFPEWRMFSLEASLRRDERQFARALELLDRAMRSVGDDNEAKAVILLQKEFVYEQMGDMAESLTALQEAIPFVEASADARHLFALRFKLANNYCHLGRHQEAAELLSQVRELGERLGNALDLVRVKWLAARVAAGLGQREEAIAKLAQVRQEFTVRGISYNAALASLDLAVLYLKEGRTADVKELAREMAEIFKAQGIAREALAALSLFVEAAQKETATVELVRRVIRKVEGAGSSSPAGAQG